MINHNSSEKKTILLVDDEIIFANATSRKLQLLGYDTILVNSGKEAIEVIRERNNIHLILMELDLVSGINGIEVAKQILLIRNIPIVFHTSHLDKENIEKIKSVSRYGFVVKNC
jgi:CheY-like chemotaxis protein